MSGASSAAPTVAVLHLGQMGAAVAAQLCRVGHFVLWCPAGRGGATVARADKAGLEPVADLAELLDRADVVLSICPPAAAEDVAASVAAHRYRGVFASQLSPFLEIRSSIQRPSMVSRTR